ncbi:MAG: DUF998 domain-containing protein [Mycobacterium sp.]|nr:DUF998 domain-containing protein [Mycobacterium sp.]
MMTDRFLRWRTRLGGALWLLQPIYLLIEIATAAQVIAPYSFLDNTISDLGARECGSVDYPFGPVPVCSPWHAMMNGSFILFGLGMALGAVLLRRALPSGRFATVSIVLWIVSGLSSVGTGLVPEDWNPAGHVAVSFPAFLAQPAALLAFGFVAGPRRGLGLSAVAAGLLSAVGTAAFMARSGSPDLGGLFERLSLWPAYLWLPIPAITARTCPRREP